MHPGIEATNEVSSELKMIGENCGCCLKFPHRSPGTNNTVS
jgi:hypothetical protein